MMIGRSSTEYRRLNEMKKPIRVFVAHQKPNFYRRLRRTFRLQRDLNLLDPAGRDSDLIRIIQKKKPQVFLLGAGFLGKDSYRLVAHIRRRSPSTKVIMLSEAYSQAQEIKAATVGARGYIAGEVEPATLRKAVRVTEAGEIWMRRKTMSLLLDEFLRSSPPS
jgi:DNA-binding NarL/FixJ family response regulator